MDYLHDVFISYSRELNWTPWTRDAFKSLLQSYLHDDLAPRRAAPEIFIDERIDVGADWVDELGSHLARSRVVVAVFSGRYFSSPWCVHELDLILERAKTCTTGARSAARLIIPVIVHDGELIPERIRRIQPADLKRWRIAGLMKNTPAYQELSEAMRDLSPKVAKAIANAPPFDEKWIDHHKQRFSKVYNAQSSGREIKPTLFKLKTPAPPAPPRIII